MALMSDALPITSAAVSNWPIAQSAQSARMPASDVGAGPLGGDLAGGGHAVITSWPLLAAARLISAGRKPPHHSRPGLCRSLADGLGVAHAGQIAAERKCPGGCSPSFGRGILPASVYVRVNALVHIPDSADSRGKLPNCSNAFIVLSLLSCLGDSTANSRLIDGIMPPRGVARNYRALACAAASERRRARDQERRGAPCSAELAGCTGRAAPPRRSQAQARRSRPARLVPGRLKCGGWTTRFSLTRGRGLLAWPLLLADLVH